MATSWVAWWDTLLDRYAVEGVMLGITWDYTQGHRGGMALGIVSYFPIGLCNVCKGDSSIYPFPSWWLWRPCFMYVLAGVVEGKEVWIL